MNLTVNTHDGFSHIMEYDHPVTAETVIRDFPEPIRYEILSCRIDHFTTALDEMINNDCTLDLLDLRDSSANMTYQASLTLLYLKAVHDVLGKDIRITVANSLSKGLFTTIHTGGLSEDTAEKIQADMQRIVNANLPIHRTTMNRRALMRKLKDNNNPKMKKLVENAADLDSADLCRIDDEEGFFYHIMVPSTGYLKWFEVRRYKNGFLLRFPHSSQPDSVPVYEEQKRLYEEFSAAARWDRITGVEYSSQLNELVLRNDYKEMILLSEALHEKRIAEIAESIHQSGRRVVLITGPSSSGKTSFARRLCIQLRVIGMHPLYLGTDDFFLNRDQTPMDEHGERNFENLEALDINLFSNTMNELLKGKKTDIPVFDFLKGEKAFGARIMSVEPGQPIIIEGIHALNPELTTAIGDEQKFRIYISPLTQLNIDDHNRIPTTDGRMLRRIVRDYQFRGASAADTINRWPSVKYAENRNIYPYSGKADMFFNSFCIYELPVLKHYAEPQLKKITPEQKEFPEAQRLLEFTAMFTAIDDDFMIPKNSILREFIGGSILL